MSLAQLPPACFGLRNDSMTCSGQPLHFWVAPPRTRLAGQLPTRRARASRKRWPARHPTALPRRACQPRAARLHAGGWLHHRGRQPEGLPLPLQNLRVPSQGAHGAQGWPSAPLLPAGKLARSPWLPPGSWQRSSVGGGVGACGGSRCAGLADADARPSTTQLRTFLLSSRCKLSTPCHACTPC